MPNKLGNYKVVKEKLVAKLQLGLYHWTYRSLDNCNQTQLQATGETTQLDALVDRA